MTHNVGSADKIARLVAGTLLLSLVLFLDGPHRWFGLIGIVPLATGLLGSCPLYSMLGISTCPAGAARH